MKDRAIRSQSRPKTWRLRNTVTASIQRGNSCSVHQHRQLHQHHHWPGFCCINQSVFFKTCVSWTPSIRDFDRKIPCCSFFRTHFGILFNRLNSMSQTPASRKSPRFNNLQEDPDTINTD